MDFQKRYNYPEGAGDPARVEERKKLIAARLQRRGLTERKHFDSADASMRAAAQSKRVGEGGNTATRVQNSIEAQENRAGHVGASEKGSILLTGPLTRTSRTSEPSPLTTSDKTFAAKPSAHRPGPAFSFAEASSSTRSPLSLPNHPLASSSSSVRTFVASSQPPSASVKSPSLIPSTLSMIERQDTASPSVTLSETDETHEPVDAPSDAELGPAMSTEDLTYIRRSQSRATSILATSMITAEVPAVSDEDEVWSAEGSIDNESSEGEHD
mmetsp:Transcript_12764/g.25894  ORF Transcript_12764/g.25894 Transcript_12764/m.25894 type:complete len:270 (-) Transcript_12764:780-1589(-)